MGGKISKHDNKRYRVRDNFKPVRWNYFDDLPINQDDPMHDPTYHLQGEPDENNGEIRNPDLDVWLPRVNESTGTTYGVDDDACGYDSGQFFYHETVLQETLPKLPVNPENIQDETKPKTPEQPDHYDVINDLEMDLSDTEQKQPMSVHKNNDHANVYHGFPKRRANYEQMVKIFKPLIVKNVNVKRLLPHLPFLYNVECKIRAIEERDPHAAIIYLIDELCSGSNTEPGRWRQFMQALEACGYKCIVDTLRGEEPVDHTYQRQYLKIITPVLRELIVPQEVVQILWAYNVISSEDKEEIIQTERMFGSLAATDKLLDMVPRRHEFWYSHFVDALTNAGRYEAADLLAIPEILDSEGEKVQKCSDTDDNIDDNEYICRKEISTTLRTNDYLEMMEDHQSNKLHFTERYKNFDCSKEYSDNGRDEIDELYMKMRKPENKPEIVNFDNFSKHSFEIEETERYEEYQPRDLSGEYRSLTDMTSEDSMSISEPPQIPQRRWNKQYSKTDINSLKVGNSLEIDIKDIKDNSSDTNSVEVIKLTTPEPTRCYFPDHTPLHSNKVKILNKPPVPSPRKRISYSEGTTKSLQTCSKVQQSGTDKSGTPKSIPSKPSETSADYSGKGVFVM
ncbi:uncharacterized protein LOC132757392 isoform X2 [Ruditapes philippinarum]|uniref:uncharacterized protein LOC132757392 isoform X2 n=1 Tax=Ruditapes philippinarum TaxID=129788 RepID=UPI00295BB89C|nr:uncharacterized protein LOC132757392 isoform X2 [Ruditapes philippinarum]